MIELLQSQARDTNNPGAQMELGPEEILLLISRDPEKTAARLAEVKARREAEAHRKVAEDAARLLRSANARFRKAERTTDPTEAARLRLEGEARLEDLAEVDATAWPWARWMYAARETDVLVPTEGQCPVYEGLRVGLPNPWNPDRTDFAEFGRVSGATVGVRETGSGRWVPKNLEQVAALKIEPGSLELDWPEDDDVATQGALPELVDQQLRYSGSWPSLGWAWAADAWLERHWPRIAPRVINRLASVRSWYAEGQKVPALVRGELKVARGAALESPELTVLPPTLAGWERFLELGPAAGLKFTELDDAGEYWWGRRVPRDLLSKARKEAEAAQAGAKAERGAA